LAYMWLLLPSTTSMFVNQDANRSI
jgi:hypothetical protein